MGTSGAEASGDAVAAPSDILEPTVPNSDSVHPFKPGLRFYAAFSSLCIINLAAALDATSLSVALPASFLHLLATIAAVTNISSETDYLPRA